MGRGRGNAFLNDLCDADSLIHVVDASGRSDAEGVDQGSSTEPCPEQIWAHGLSDRCCNFTSFFVFDFCGRVSAHSRSIAGVAHLMLMLDSRK